MALGRRFRALRRQGLRGPEGRATAIGLAAAAVGAVLVIAAADPFGGGGGEGGAAQAGRSGWVSSVRGGEAVVWAVGDGADGGSTARRVARMISRDRPDRLLYLGDVYEDGTRAEFRSNYATTYGRLAARTAPTPGNHDWPNHRQGYDPYWAHYHGRPAAPWHSLRAGGWQLVSLNSEAPHDADSPQLRWLRRVVAGPGDCRLAFWHRPRHSAGTHHGDQPDVQPFWDALRGRTTLVVNGHEHDMQRFAPRGGVHQLISGAGGAGLYPVEPRPGLAFSNDTDFGALRLELRPGSARWAFVTVDGRRLDSGRVRCRPG